MSEQLLSLPDAAARLGIHVNTLSRMIERGELPSVALGKRANGQARRRMVAESVIDGYIAANTEGRATDGE